MHSIKEQAIISKLNDAIQETTDIAIDFLCICFDENESEINELGCGEIFSIVEEKTSETSLDEIKEILELTGFEIPDFDMALLDNKDENMRKPCKNPCPSCPYTKNAIKGDFGGNDPEEYAQAIHLDTVVACHSRTKHNEITGEASSDGDITICTGHIVSQIKSCKSSRHPEGIKAHALVRSFPNLDKLKDNALAFDFKSFHNIN